MININSLIEHNSLIKRLIADGEISRTHLKGIYRHLCKITHPDVMPKDGIEFINLQKEYEEAEKYLDEIKLFFNKENAPPYLSSEDIRKQFYLSLRHYSAAGLHSVRMRIKPEIRKRNMLVINEVLYWAKLYNTSFVEVFLNYNRIYFKRFIEWNKRDRLFKAQKIFIFGLNAVLDYEYSGSPRAYRAAKSYLEDAVSILEFTRDNAASISVRDFAEWLIIELESLHLFFTESKKG